MKGWIFLGKGGVGKSTLAVALASILPNSCVVSIDQQQNHVDIIKQNNLDVKYGILHNEVTDNIMQILSALGFGAFKDYAPIIAQDFIVLCQLAFSIYDYVNSVDNLVIDFPPNCNSINLLYMPNALESVIFKIMTIKQRIKRMVTGNDKTLELIDEYNMKMQTLGDILRDANIYTVGIPSELGFIETEKITEICIKNNLNFKGIINNMINDSDCDCRICKMYIERQNEARNKFMQFTMKKMSCYYEIQFGDFYSIRYKLEQIIKSIDESIDE